MAKRSYTLVGEGEIRAKTEMLDLVWDDDEPVRLGDFGHRLRISGVYFQGEGVHVLVLTPTAQDYVDAGAPATVPVRHPDLETWSSIILQTDDPVLFERDETGLIKAVQRKVQYQISGGTQWAIWERDGFQCLYCGMHGGTGCPLTIDHFVPLARGGENKLSNYVSCCRRCAKDKGDQPPQGWMDAQGLDYYGLKLFIEGKAPISFIAHLQE